MKQDFKRALEMYEQGFSWEAIKSACNVTARELYGYVRPDGPPTAGSDE